MNLRVDFTHALNVDTSGGKIRSTLTNTAENDIIRNTVLFHMGNLIIQYTVIVINVKCIISIRKKYLEHCNWGGNGTCLMLK